MAKSPVSILFGNNGTDYVELPLRTGIAVPSGQPGVMVLGSDGTDTRYLLTDAAGKLSITATALPLPTGAATETTLAALNAKIPASPAQEHTTAGSPSSARLTDGAAFYKATTPADTQPISAASLPLPSGAATETTLSTRLAESTFTTRINTLGQKAMSASMPVVLASDQSELQVKQGTAAAAAGGWPVKITDGTNTIGTLSKTLYTDPNGDRRTVHNNATITASGSSVLTWVGHSEWYLIINLKNAPTGTAPTIQFKIEQLDPIDQVTVLTGERVYTGTVRTAAGTDIIEVPELTSDTVKISWTVTGATPSWTGVNASFCGHGPGNAIEGQAQVGEQAGDAPVPIALVDSNNVIQRIRGDDLGNIGIATNLVTGYSPDPQNHIDVPQPLASDPSSNLLIRGQVLTDEGSFRDDFDGSSLFTSLTGTYSFTNGSVDVTGVGTAFTTELSTDSYIRIGSHGNTALVAVEQVIDDTTLVLASGYTGATAASTAVESKWLVSIPASPANVTVGSSLVNLIASTVTETAVSIRRNGDYLPFVVVATLSLSQRIANQRSVVGFQDGAPTWTKRAVFVFEGTDSSKVKCVSAYSSGSVQEVEVTLPGGGVTSGQHVYSIEQLPDRTVFLIDGTRVATNSIHLPAPYAILSQVLYVENTGTVASATTLSVDSCFFSNRDLLAMEEPVAIEGVPGGQPIIIQFGNPGGGTSLPKLINVNFNKSEGAIVANSYKRIASYTVPASYNGYLIKFVSFQGEAASSRVVAETNMGSHNDNTNVFTAGTSYAAPQWSGIAQAEVTTAYATGSGNVVLTVTYTNENGVGGRSGTVTIPKGSAVGSRFDFAFQSGDLGVQSIQAVTGTPTQVGVCKILGLVQLALHQDQSTTTQTETLYAPGAITFPPGTVLGIEYAGGTVSKSRLLDMLVQLVQ